METLNILIDTCSLINLLSENKNKLLPHLEYWSANNYINLYSHEVIIEEWGTHKPNELKKHSQSIINKYRNANEVLERENLIPVVDLSPKTDIIESQIARIDNLLSSSTTLYTCDSAKIICADKSKNNQAPFINKKDSMKDAYIIFSALKYFNDINENFIFISANYTDFGRKDNSTKELHQDIINEYPKIKVTYYVEIGEAINDLKKQLPCSHYKSTDSNENFEDDICVDKTKHILDQLHNYMKNRYKELNFIPHTLLTNNTIFRGNKRIPTSCRAFELTIHNRELSELLIYINNENNKAIACNADFFKNTSDVDEKLLFIKEHFVKNLIYKISSTKGNIEINYSGSKDANCDTLKYSLNRLQLGKTLKLLCTKYNNIAELFDQSYVHYRIGNFILAYKILKEILVRSKKEELEIFSIIAQYNISKLGIFIKKAYWHVKDNSIDPIIEEIDNFSNTLDKISLSTKTKEIFENIKNLKMYTKSLVKIQTITSSIIDNYQNQLNGGCCSNDLISELFFEFGSVDAFYEQNNIIYNYFEEYSILRNTFFEGVFASYAITSTNYSRLISFDNWLVSKLIQFGDTNSMKKLYHKYKIKKIKLSDPSFLVEISSNFFNETYEELNLQFNSSCEKDNRFFGQYYNKIFNNLLALISIAEFNDNEYKTILDNLSKYLDTVKQLNHDNIKMICFLINVTHNQVNREFIHNLFRLFLINSSFQDIQLLETISNLVEMRKWKIEISEANFNKIEKICLRISPERNELVILNFYSIISNRKYLLKIRKMIKTSLELHFNFMLFYDACMDDIIHVDEKKMHEVFLKIYPSDIDSFGGDRKNTLFGLQKFHKIDHFINLCFKSNIKINSAKFQKIKDIGEYYSWLVDMDNFNYDLFNIEWINAYPTKYFYKKMAKSKSVKRHIEKIINLGIDSTELEKSYFDIYIRKLWA